MTYAVKELFYTLQGEGANTGRAAVFCRCTGCNLWTGREADRASAICNFCDTEFVGTDGKGGGKFHSPESLAQAARDTVAEAAAPGLIVCTGGEPMLQLDQPLIEALHAQGFEVAVETNGTIKVPTGVDWICVSPKAATPLVQISGDELKLVYPQKEPEAQPENFAQLDFTHFFLQPMDGEDMAAATANAVHYCQQHPQWRLSVQSHKYLGIP